MTPIRIKSNWQLFIDDFICARTTGFDRIVHHPHYKGVVIPADKPWETAGVTPKFVQRQPDGTFIAHCMAMWWDSSLAKKETSCALHVDRAHQIASAVAYLTSPDGIHWDKPNLGLMDAPAGIDWSNAPFADAAGKTRDNNLGVPYMFVADLMTHGNVSDPAKRYALRLAPQAPGGFPIGANWTLAPKGYFAAELPDFIHDPNWQQKLTDSGGNFDPRRHIVHFWDDIHEEWVAIEQGVVPNWLPSREIGRFASKDLVHWTSQSVLYPDALDPHRQDYYDEPMSMHPFYSDGVVLGLLDWFHSDRTHPLGGPIFKDTTKPTGHPDNWPFCRKGLNEVRITISRDGGKTWDRTASREAFIPHGVEHDSDNRVIFAPCPPVHVDDEDWFYTTVVGGDHLLILANAEQSSYYRDRIPRQQTGLYVQKHNRFVSLTAKNYKEILVTKPVLCEGTTLQVNADACRGSIRVAVAPGEPVMTYNDTTPAVAPHLLPAKCLPGFTFDDCVPLQANSVTQNVHFKNAKLESLKGKPVCLLFEVLDADLYGFRIA